VKQVTGNNVSCDVIFKQSKVTMAVWKHGIGSNNPKDLFEFKFNLFDLNAVWLCY